MKYVLFMYVDPSSNLGQWYRDASLQRNPEDSGFDLFNPTTVDASLGLIKIDYGVKCAMYELGEIPLSVAFENMDRLKPQAFYLYARSSIAKTNLRLANSVGIIDSGYRGNIGAYFDVLYNGSLEEKSRYVQICHPSLDPFEVIMVNNESDLGVTKRGAGGFGSTGV
jgi:dUTP pyrophosphatase